MVIVIVTWEWKCFSMEWWNHARWVSCDYKILHIWYWNTASSLSESSCKLLSLVCGLFTCCTEVTSSSSSSCISSLEETLYLFVLWLQVSSYHTSVVASQGWGICKFCLARDKMTYRVKKFRSCRWRYNLCIVFRKKNEAQRWMMETDSCGRRRK